MEYRVVTLTDGEMPQIATFEDAFGEFSEARGRGRQRRAEKRRARQEKRKEKRRARQEKRMQRIKDRAARRAERRKMRTEATKERLARRRMRKEERIARRGLGEEEYEEPESEDMGEDTGEEEFSEEEEGSEEEPMEESGEEGSEEEYSEEGGEEESGADGYYGFNAKTDNFDEYFTFVGDDFYNLDAVTYDDNVYDIAEFSKGAEDYYSSADGTPSQINPKVAQITNKIEWNKEFIARLNKKLRSSRMGREEVAKLRKRLKNRQEALARLQQQLKNYSTIATKRKGAKETNREISKALNVSRYNRLKAIGGERLGMSPEKALAKCMELNKKRAEMKETPVSADLNPQISQDKIVVPPSENTTASSCATGLTGVDDAYDFDSPAPRAYDMEFSSAAGDDAKTKKKKRNRIIAITAGVVVAGIIIYLIARRKK